MLIAAADLMIELRLLGILPTLSPEYHLSFRLFDLYNKTKPSNDDGPHSFKDQERRDGLGCE